MRCPNRKALAQAHDLGMRPPIGHCRLRAFRTESYLTYDYEPIQEASLEKEQ